MIIQKFEWFFSSIIEKFNLIPWDHESYLVAADYAEEQGFSISNAIRNKILPLDREKGDGRGKLENPLSTKQCIETALIILENRILDSLGNGTGRSEGCGSGWGGGNSFGVGIGRGSYNENS